MIWKRIFKKDEWSKDGRRVEQDRFGWINFIIEIKTLDNAYEQVCKKLLYKLKNKIFNKSIKKLTLLVFFKIKFQISIHVFLYNKPCAYKLRSN